MSVAPDPQPVYITNSVGARMVIPKLHGDTPEERLASLIAKYDYPHDILWHTYDVDPALVACIGYSETWLGKKNIYKNNPWNIGNREYDDLRDWFSAIAYLLSHWTYLGNKETIGDLYPSMWYCTTDCDYFYASWEDAPVNVLNCMNAIYQKPIYHDFEYKNNHLQ